MNRHEPISIRFHKDVEFFREAVNYTAAETGFVPRLIEKDYFCTVLLAGLPNEDHPLIFKGGTCLAKVHAGFYRLSEDMDFAIPMPEDATRSQRSEQAKIIKKVFTAVLRTAGCLEWIEPLRGANDSSQYLGSLGYHSLLTGQKETILVEVSLREPLLTKPHTGMAQTLLINPITRKPMVAPFAAPCLSKIESLAEKFRAAMTRREVAIRDFYDIQHATGKLGIKPGSPELLDLLRNKLSVPGNDPVKVDQERLAQLRIQLEARLKPVLRQQDYDSFSLDRAFNIVAEVARTLQAQKPVER